MTNEKCVYLWSSTCTGCWCPVFIYMEQNLPLASYRQMLGSILENVLEAKIKEEEVEMDMKELCKNYYYL